MIRICLFLLFVGLIAGGYWMYTHGASLQSALAKVPFITQNGGAVSEGTTDTNAIKDSLASLSMPQIPGTAGKQLGTVSNRAQEVGKTVGNVLGTAVQQASSSGSLQEKAFDYGRYLYCQQVVKDYEARTAQ